MTPEQKKQQWRESFGIFYYDDWGGPCSGRFLIAIFSGPIGELPTHAAFPSEEHIERLNAFLGHDRIREHIESQRKWWVLIQEGKVPVADWVSSTQTHYMSCIRCEFAGKGLLPAEDAIRLVTKTVWRTDEPAHHATNPQEQGAGNG